MTKIIKVTKKEYEFLKGLEGEYTTTESDDGLVSGYVSADAYDMKVVRGIMGSLVKKGVISSKLEEHSYNGDIFYNDCDVYHVVVKEEYGNNYKLTNLEFEGESLRPTYESVKIVDEPNFKRFAIKDTDTNSIVIQTASSTESLNGCVVFSYDQVKQMAKLIEGEV